MAVERFKCCENIEHLAKELGVARQTLYRWHKMSECAEEGEDPVLAKSRESRFRREIRDLKCLLAEDRKPGPGLVHHSARGVQYLHANYVATLRKYSIVASVSRPGNPGDNANCESFFRTLKREEIRATQYANVEDLRTKISRFIDNYYNRKRLHSALGYRSPAEFEKVAISVGTAGISSVIELDS